MIFFYYLEKFTFFFLWEFVGRALNQSHNDFVGLFFSRFLQPKLIEFVAAFLKIL